MLTRSGWGGLYLALITHECAQVGCLVPRRCSGIDDNALRVCWWGEHDGGKTRCLILEDETSIRILGSICQLRLRGEQQKVLDVRVPCEVPEKRGWGQAFVDKENFDRQGQEWNVHSIKGIPEGVATLLECLHGSVDGPFQSIDPRISRNTGCGFAWRKKKGILVSVQDRGNRIAQDLHACTSSASAISPSVLAPRLILRRCHSPRRRVLWRSIACFTGPSPAWMPPERRRSWTSTNARLWEVIFFSSLKRFAAAITSASAGLSRRSV